MIYIASSIVLSLADYTSLANPVFCWRNFVTVDGIEAEEEDEDYPATNIANPDTSLLWKGETTDEQSITFTLTIDDMVDYVGIARHNFGSSGAEIALYGLTEDEGASEVLLAELSPGDDSPILALFDGGYYTQLRILITPGDAIPQMAVAYAGKALFMPRSTPTGFVHVKDGMERETLIGIAENGDFLGDVVLSERYATPVEFKLIDGTWYRENMRDFVQSMEPFFYAWSPTQLPNEIGFAKLTSVPKGAVNQYGGQVDVSLPIVALAL